MYRVFDEETQTNHSYKRKSNPFDERNYIVMRGWKDEGQTRKEIRCIGYSMKRVHKENVWHTVEVEITAT